MMIEPCTAAKRAGFFLLWIATMLFSPQDQEWLVPFWEQHITPTLGPKATRQFVKATLKPSNWLGDTIIKPRLFRAMPSAASTTPWT
jgi:hypothetical protein